MTASLYPCPPPQRTPRSPSHSRPARSPSWPRRRGRSPQQSSWGSGSGSRCNRRSYRTVSRTPLARRPRPRKSRVRKSRTPSSKERRSRARIFPPARSPTRGGLRCAHGMAGLVTTGTAPRFRGDVVHEGAARTGSTRRTLFGVKLSPPRARPPEIEDLLTAAVAGIFLTSDDLQTGPLRTSYIRRRSGFEPRLRLGGESLAVPDQDPFSATSKKARASGGQRARQRPKSRMFSDPGRGPPWLRIHRMWCAK